MEFIRLKISRPPLRLVLALIGMLLVSLQGWIRFVLSITNWKVYDTFGVLPGVWYLTLSGLFSCSIYLMAAVLVIINFKRFRRISSILLLTGLGGYWFDRFFAAISPDARTTLPFALISSLVLTLTAIGILYWDTIGIRTKL
jgi:hypothetical protein